MTTPDSLPFYGFYQSFWGDRWSTLYPSLLQPNRQIKRYNKFISKAWPLKKPLPELANCEWAEELDYTHIPRDLDSQLFTYYIQDPGSVWLTEQLPVAEAERVLDMCAAPGGKTLILAERTPPACQIIANEPQPERRQRLIKNIRGYCSPERRNQIFVTGKNGGLFAKTHREQFDAILVDAPCSGERFFFAETIKQPQLWNPKRSQRLAQEQYALLTAALLACRPGGWILFSTCSISPLENNAVIEKLLKKKGDQFEIVPLPPHAFSEANGYGAFILPDRVGFGPFYLTLLKKKT